MTRNSGHHQPQSQTQEYGRYAYRETGGQQSDGYNLQYDADEHQPQSFFFQNKQTRQQQGSKISDACTDKERYRDSTASQYGIVKETVYKRNQQPRNEGDQNHIDGRHPSTQQQKAVE